MIGEVIGNFKVVKRLGSGGMGDVYLAEHKEMQTPVAVKLLNRDISNNKDHVQRFFNEARVVSKIKSAGTVKIFDSGFHNEQAYLIMELLDGESLATRIGDRGPLPVQQVLDISRQIASVLDATHRQGVTHRDLKPDNIFIVHDDERASGERVKILDFGIAKLSGTMAMASPKTSGTMGTPGYMAPEQWGDSSKIDWRADAYSLGCVMFELACGRPPFQSATIAEAFVNHVTTEPPAPSSLAADVPPELDQLILRLLAKDPAARAESMGQVTRELAELLGEPIRERAQSQPSLSVPPTSPDPARTVSERPQQHLTPHPSAHPIAVPMSTATTLGGSAAQLASAPAPKRRLALVAGIGTLAVAAVVLMIVMTASKDNGNEAQPTAAPAPTAAPPAPEPAMTPPAPPEPAAAVAPPEPTPPPVVEPPPVEPPPAVVEKPAPAPVTEAKPQRQRKAPSTTATATKPTETKPVTKPAETKPAETKPAETKPAETKPVETKPAETKPAAGSGSAAPTTGRKRFGGGGRL